MPFKKLPIKPKPNTTDAPSVEWSFEAIGTHWWVGLYQACNPQLLATIQQRIADRIAEFDKTYSRFRADSTVTAIAQQSGDYSLPADAAALLHFYRQLYISTDGRVTPLIGQLISDAGYDASYSLQPSKLQPTPTWEDVMQYKDGHLITTQPVLLDFGAAGKGYLVDIVAELLADAGIQQFCIDAGGDMLCRGLTQPIRVGMENPDNNQQVIGVANLQNAALCGSSGSKRTWGDYHHIMDPSMRASPRHIKAVWVVANDCMMADGLTTALYFTQPQPLQSLYDFEYVIIHSDNTVTQSPGFPVELFVSRVNNA